MDDRFSARRGTYRVIYRIDDKAHVVTVVDVAHRFSPVRSSRSRSRSRSRAVAELWRHRVPEG